MKNGKRVNVLLLLILFFFVGVAGVGLFNYYGISTHDGHHHIARGYDAIRSFSEGHFPLRWAGSLNYFCGVPIFNFFYPLIYYLVIILNPFTSDVIITLKIISILSLVVGTISFYLWLKNETKNIYASFAGAVLYLFVPYRLLLIYVRNSPEYLAYAIFPLVLYFYSKALEEKQEKKFTLFLFAASLTGGLMAISHNFTVMFLMPILFVYLILKVCLQKRLDLKNCGYIAFSY